MQETDPPEGHLCSPRDLIHVVRKAGLSDVQYEQVLHSEHPDRELAELIDSDVLRYSDTARADLVKILLHSEGHSGSLAASNITRTTREALYPLRSDSSERRQINIDDVRAMQLLSGMLEVSFKKGTLCAAGGDQKAALVFLINTLTKIHGRVRAGYHVQIDIDHELIREAMHDTNRLIADMQYGTYQETELKDLKGRQRQAELNLQAAERAQQQCPSQESIKSQAQKMLNRCGFHLTDTVMEYETVCDGILESGLGFNGQDIQSLKRFCALAQRDDISRSFERSDHDLHSTLMKIVQQENALDPELARQLLHRVPIHIPEAESVAAGLAEKLSHALQKRRGNPQDRQPTPKRPTTPQQVLEVLQEPMEDEDKIARQLEALLSIVSPEGTDFSRKYAIAKRAFREPSWPSRLAVLQTNDAKKHIAALEAEEPVLAAIQDAACANGDDIIRSRTAFERSMGNDRQPAGLYTLKTLLMIADQREHDACEKPEHFDIAQSVANHRREMRFAQSGTFPSYNFHEAGGGESLVHFDPSHKLYLEFMYSALQRKYANTEARKSQ